MGGFRISHLLHQCTQACNQAGATRLSHLPSTRTNLQRPSRGLESHQDTVQPVAVIRTPTAVLLTSKLLAVSRAQLTEGSGQVSNLVVASLRAKLVLRIKYMLWER